MKPLGPESIKVVLPLAPGFDQARSAQQRQVMADGRLALAEQFAKCADVKFFRPQQIMQDSQPRGVGQ